MKLWLLALTKTPFLMTFDIKLTLGNIFMKVKNPPGGATVTKKIKTNLKTLVSPLLIRSQRSQGCQKIRFFFLQMKMFSFCAKIAPRRHKLQKTIKIEEKMLNKPCFLGLFWIFLNLGAILAQQTSTGMFSGSWGIFWHSASIVEIQEF